MASSAAFFCLERVMLVRGPEPVFSRQLKEAGLAVPAVAPLAELSSRLLSLGVGENAWSARAGRAALAPGKSWSVEAVHRAAERSADELESQLLPYAPIEVDDHRAAGRTLVLVSAHPEPLVTPLADRWGFDHVVATGWESSHGAFTGRSTGPLVWGSDRLDAVRQWASDHDVALDESYVLAGSFADAPLLAAAGHRRVVNPDPRLAATAAARRWPVRWFDVPPGVVKVAGRELQEWLRPVAANEQLVSNAQIEISGVENIPRRGAAILAFNHRSYFDATVISMVIAKAGRSARGIGKKEVFDAPIIGPFAHAFGGIRVDRGTGSNEPLHRAEQALRAGELIMIAPEGTIPRGPAFFEPELKGRWGTARLAHATGAPVIPAGLWGTEHVWPRNQRLPRLAFPTGLPRVTVRIGPPVELAHDDVDSDTKRIMAAIVDQLPPEARVRRTPTERELRRTYPANYRGDPTRELQRRPGFDI